MPGGMDTRYVEIPSGRIRVHESGSGTPVLAIHGLFNSGETFSRFFERLPEGLRGVAPDLPGFGETSPAPGFSPSWEGFASAAVETADALGLDRFHLVGHSMGGGIAALVCASHPDRIDRLVLVDAVSFPHPLPLKGRLPRIPVLGRIAFALYGEGMFVSYFANDVFNDESAMDLSRVRRHYRYLDRQRSMALASLRAVGDPSPVAAAIGRIRRPTLALWGADDRLVPAWVGERIERSVEDAVHRAIPGCGHAPLEERPDEAARIVVDFLGGRG